MIHGPVGTLFVLVHGIVTCGLLLVVEPPRVAAQDTTSRFPGGGSTNVQRRGGLYFGDVSGIYFGDVRMTSPRGSAGSSGRTGATGAFGGVGGFGGGLLSGGGQDLLAAATVNSLLNGNTGINGPGFNRSGGYLGDSLGFRSGFPGRTDRRRRDAGWQQSPIRYDTRFRIGFAAPSVGAEQLQTNLQQTLRRASLGAAASQVTVRVELLAPQQGSATVAVLQGTVATDDDRSVIEHLVRMQPGVAQVQNRLELSEAEVR